MSAPDALPRVDVAEAARIVRASGVIAYPTEAVFGLGCDPANTDALRRVLATKTRAEDKGLILVAGVAEHLDAWIAPLDARARALVEPTWPGHTTWVVPARPTAVGLVTGGRDTLAVRVSAHPTVRALCDVLGHALVSTSANRSGEPAIRDDAELDALEGVDAVVAGELGGAAAPSAIYRLADGVRLR
ncbi:MAG: Sua5/YciO/YrdC/YwlC family protein [Pseudomonadota bacterium]